MTPRQRFVSTALGVLAGSIATLGTLAVVAAGFSLSFDAIRAVGEAAHIRPSMTWLLPVCVDGAMSVSAVCAVVLKRMGRSNVYPWAVVLVGAAISIAANALHAYQRGGDVPLPVEWAMAASSVPALLLALSVHLVVILAEAVRQPGTAEKEMVPPSLSATVADPHPSYDAAMAVEQPERPVVHDATWAIINQRFAEIGGRAVDSYQRALRDAASANGKPSAPLATTPNPKPVTQPRATRRNGRKATTADRVARLVTRSPDLSKAEVAARLKVSERTVQRLWPATVASPNGSEPPQQE